MKKECKTPSIFSPSETLFFLAGRHARLQSCSPVPFLLSLRLPFDSTAPSPPRSSSSSSSSLLASPLSLSFSLSLNSIHSQELRDSTAMLQSTPMRSFIPAPFSARSRLHASIFFSLSRKSCLICLIVLAGCFSWSLLHCWVCCEDW